MYSLYFYCASTDTATVTIVKRRVSLMHESFTEGSQENRESRDGTLVVWIVVRLGWPEKRGSVEQGFESGYCYGQWVHCDKRIGVWVGEKWPQWRTKQTRYSVKQTNLSNRRFKIQWMVWGHFIIYIYIYIYIHTHTHIYIYIYTY